MSLRAGTFDNGYPADSMARVGEALPRGLRLEDDSKAGASRLREALQRIGGRSHLAPFHTRDVGR